MPGALRDLLSLLFPPSFRSAAAQLRRRLVAPFTDPSSRRLQLLPLTPVRVKILTNVSTPDYFYPPSATFAHQTKATASTKSMSMPVNRAQLTNALEDDVAQHSQAIAEMKYRPNSFAATAVLAPELLVEVFLHLAHSALSTTHHSSLSFMPQAVKAPVETSGSPYAWLKVTHVCQHWREVALGAPQLWSAICANGSIEFLREIISRSQHVPLSIDARRGFLCAEGLNLIMQELPRIVAFHVRSPPHLRSTGYSQDGKKLKELCLQASDSYGASPLDLIQLQDHFAVCHLPLLERLELCGCQISRYSKLIQPTLKHLTWRQMGDPNEGSMEELLQVLANLPLLETLSLASCLPIPLVGGQDHITHTVDLPNLRQMHLSDELSACKAFLQHVSFPSDTLRSLNVFLGYFDDVEDAEDSDDLEALIKIVSCARDIQLAAEDAKVGEGAGLPLLRSLDLRYGWEDGLMVVYAWPTFHSLQEMHVQDTKPETLPDPFLGICLHSASSVSLSSLLRTLINPEIQSLLVGGESVPEPINKEEWLQAFEQLPKLLELALGEFAKDLVFETLDHCLLLTQEASSKSGKKPCMPKLEVLRVVLWGEKETFLRRLGKSLAARKKAKVPLKTLIIHANPDYLVEEEADCLREYVGSLEVTHLNWEFDDEAEEVWNI